MRRVLQRMLVSAAVGGAFAVTISQPAATAPAAALPACTAAQLVPQVGATMVNQGVGSYADPAGNLVRGKDTVVRFFLMNQTAVGSACSGTAYVRSATLDVTSSGGAGPIAPAPAALQTFGTSGTAIPAATVSADANSDPKFLIPGNLVNSCLATGCATTGGFTLTFTLQLSYSINGSATLLTLPTAPTKIATFDRASNALRILAIPMGDASQQYSTQFSDAARVAVENGFAALGRIYPLPGGVSSTLNSTTGGIRYKLDLAAMLNLRGITGAYDANGKFCGTQANFDAGIKSQLAGYLSVYNSSITDPSQAADRVVGVVDKNISDGSTSTFNCAEAMASTNSPQAWVRAIPDTPAAGKTPAVPSMTGPLMAMELAHTFALDTTISFHSPNTQADGTAPERGYNISSRSYLSDDRSVMRFVATNPFNNNNALFEKDDYAHMLCNLGGSIATNCTGGGAATGTTVAAGPTFAIFGTTDFTPSGTHVLESYGSDNDPIFTGSSSSGLSLEFSNSSGRVGDPVPVPYSNVSSEHDDATAVHTTTALFGGVFEAPAGYTTVKLLYNGAPLYTRSSAPLDNLSAGIGDASPGGSMTVKKTLTTPAIPPKPDVVFLADTTGSMDAEISNVKTNVATIMNNVKTAQPDAQFGAASYKDFNCAGDVPFTLDHALTPTTADVVTAIGTWSAPPGSGCDAPEAQIWALHELATRADIGWRPGSTRIVVWIGDAPGHDPSGPEGGQISLATAISELKAAGIRVIAINLPSGEGTTLDDPPGQATAVVNATGGVLKTTSSPEDVSPAITAGLTNLPATVTPQVTTCDPALSIAFAPTSSTVTSGTAVSFTENISISNSATSGSTLTCTITFPVNGVLPDDPEFTQTLSITLTGKAAVVGTFEATNPANVNAHIVYDCGNGEKEPAFVGVDGTTVANNVVQFQKNVDPSLACANASGTASLTIVATNGVDAEPVTVPTTSNSLPVADKSPSAAIYQPTLDATIAYTSQFSLNGHIADPEDGNITAHWAIVSGPLTPAIAATTDVVDVPPPAEGWPAGDYVIRLTGTDSKGHGATAEATVHVARYAFSGFLAPVDNPPTLNAGKAGKTYPVKWSLTQNGTAVTDLSAVESVKFAGAPCGTAPTDSLETTTTGGTSLRFEGGQFIYNWATPSAPGCYVLLLTLADGSTWPAYFKLS
jgi:hypothetical protein